MVFLPNARQQEAAGGHEIKAREIVRRVMLAGVKGAKSGCRRQLFGARISNVGRSYAVA